MNGVAGLSSAKIATPARTRPAESGTAWTSVSMERQIALLTISLWFSSFALSTVRDLADPPNAFAQTIAIRVGFAVVGALFCLPLHVILRLADEESLAKRLLLISPAVIFLAVVYTQATLAVQRAVAGATAGFGAGWTFYNTVYWLLFFVAWTALHLALTSSHEARNFAERARSSDALAHEAQLRALRYQVDPHFLFNTLNSVSALVISGRVAEAERMLARLSRYFRSTVAVDPLAEVPLRDELEMQRSYLEIEQVRFPDLSVEMRVTTDAGPVHVPALLLQPLVENAIKFGVSRNDKAGGVRIEAFTENSNLVVVVENDAGRASADLGGTGTGLRNTLERLRAFYGDRAELTAGSVPGDRFRAEVRLPIEDGQ